VAFVLKGGQTVKRTDIAVDKLSWGDLEHKGAAFLCPTQTTGEFTIKIPFIFLHKYIQDFNNFPEEPVLSMNNRLDDADNEKQDLATVLHNLWRESVLNKQTEVDLAEFIPGLAKGKYAVKPPKCFKMRSARSQIKNKNLLWVLFSSKKKGFAKDGQAFINASKSSWGDTFLFFAVR
jgi:hypothetical protein